MLIAAVLVYLLLTLCIGFITSRYVSSTQDFVLAGRNLPTVVAACALFATWFGSETVLGASSEFAEKGLYGVIEDPFGAALCLFLVGIFFVKPLYNQKLLTLSDFYRQRFGKKNEQVAAWFMVLSYFTWIAAQFKAIGIIFHQIAELPLWVGTVLGCVIVVTYTFAGGMWAVAITDFLQTIIIILGLGYIFYVVQADAGGIVHVIQQAPPDFFQFLPKNNLQDYLLYIAAWVTIGLGSIPQQDIFQRIMSAKSERTAIQASYWGAVMYLTVAFFPLMIALCGRYMHPDLLQGDTQMLLPAIVLKHGSVAVQVLFFGALISAIMSTASGALLAPAAVTGENIIKPLFKTVNDTKLLWLIRWSVVAIALISLLLGLTEMKIYHLVAASSVLSLVSLFVPLTAGLFWKKANAIGAMTSMLLGVIGWLIGMYWETVFPDILLGLLAAVVGMLLGSWWGNSKKI